MRGGRFAMLTPASFVCSRRLHPGRAIARVRTCGRAPRGTGCRPRAAQRGIRADSWPVVTALGSPVGRPGRGTFRELQAFVGRMVARIGGRVELGPCGGRRSGLRGSGAVSFRNRLQESLHLAQKRLDWEASRVERGDTHPSVIKATTERSGPRVQDGPAAPGMGSAGQRAFWRPVGNRPSNAKETFSACARRGLLRRGGNRNFAAELRYGPYRGRRWNRS